MRKLGVEKRLSRRHRAVLYRYIEDMRVAVTEVSRVLVPGGKAVFVLGDNTVRGTYISNSKIVAMAALYAGLRLEGKHTRTLPPNSEDLPPPSRKTGNARLNTRLHREVVFSFIKPH